MEQIPKQIQPSTVKSWYDKYYFILMVIPVIIMVLSLVYLGVFYSKNNSLIYKDVSLSGGTTITLNGEFNTDDVELALKEKFPDIVTRKLTDLRTGKQLAFIIESSSSPEEIQPELEKILGYKLTEQNSSIEFTGPALSQSFYNELLKLIFISFVLMAMVIFLIFGESKLAKSLSIALSFGALRLTFPNRTFILVLLVLTGIISLAYSYFKAKSKKDYVYMIISAIILLLIIFLPNYTIIYPIIYFLILILLLFYFVESLPSIAVIFAAFCDIVLALAVVNLMGIRLSAAGIAAFLMLIGYSVDTDILLTSRALQREDTLNKRIYRAFKTGILMTLTALAAILPAFFIVTGLPDSFRQIFLILAIGLGADIFNTWLTNAGIIKWYIQRRERK